MVRTFPDLPEWSFDVDEVSAGVYRVIGSTTRGRQVSQTGTDVQTLLEQCKRQASRITATGRDW